jgi:hypothetical protein
MVFPPLKLNGRFSTGASMICLDSLGKTSASASSTLPVLRFVHLFFHGFGASPVSISSS